MADDSSDFLADIDEKFDQRLAMAARSPDEPKNHGRKTEAYAPPSLDPDAFTRPSKVSGQPTSTPDTPHARAPKAGTMNFIAELEQEAAARQQSKAHCVQNDEDKARQLHDALSRIFDFLNQLSRHANLLEPEISRVYRLDAQTAYSGLRWHGAFADFRKQDLSENARLSHASFRVRFVAPQPVTLLRRWDQMESLKKDLHILDLRMIDEDVFAKKAEQEFVKVHLAPEFTVQMNFKANYTAQRIDILCRNLEGFGISAFILDTTQVNQSLLEELGRFLLSRSNALPGALRRVNHVPGVKKTDPG